MRPLFGERVLKSLMDKSTAVSNAGLAQQKFYEVRRENFARTNYISVRWKR